MLVSSLVLGPFSGWLLFCLPCLRASTINLGGVDKANTIRVLKGWEVPLFYFFLTSLLWSGGCGPFLYKDYIQVLMGPVKLFKYDLFL